MSGPTDVVLAAGDDVWETLALQELERSSVLRLARRCVDVADLLAVAHADRATVALVSVTLPGLDADAVHRIEASGVRVVAVEATDESASALGIGQVVELGRLDEVEGSPEPQARPSEAVEAPMLAVWGPSGAPGRSVVALTIAAAAAARGTSTVLVDADPYGGSQAQSLAVLDEVSGLVAACRAANAGRQHEVVDHLVEIDAGLRLLSGIPRPDMWSQVRPGALDLVLDAVRRDASLVVVDCGFGLDASGGGGSVSRHQATVQVLERSSRVVAVGRAEPVGLSRLVRGVHELAEVVPGASEPVLVINMMRPSLGWREKEVDATVTRLTGRSVDVFLPFDQAGLDLATVSGRTPREAAPGSPFVARLEALLPTLVPRRRIGADGS